MMYVIMWRKKTFIFRAYNSWRMRKWWELCMGPEHWTLTRRCLRPAPVTRTRSGPGHWLRAPEQLTGNTRRGWRGGALRGARGHASISPSLHCRVTAPPRSWFVNWYLQHPRTTQLFLNIYTLKVKTTEHLSTGGAPLLFQRQSYATSETSGNWTEIPQRNSPRRCLVTKLRTRIPVTWPLRGRYYGGPRLQRSGPEAAARSTAAEDHGRCLKLRRKPAGSWWRSSPCCWGCCWPPSCSSCWRRPDPPSLNTTKAALFVK